MPKFKIESKHDDLVENLKQIGIQQAFDGGKADFSGISTNAMEKLYISRIIQKTYINVL